MNEQASISQEQQNVQSTSSNSGTSVTTSSTAATGTTNNRSIPGLMTQLWNNGPTTSMHANTINSQIEKINIQQNLLRDQIRQSEHNLSAQHEVNIKKNSILKNRMILIED